MKYSRIVMGTFQSRPNRFIAYVETSGEIVKVHVKNTGRCKELLVFGATVFLEDFGDRMGNRKLRYSLISVIKNDGLINIDSQAPNKVVYEAIENGKIKIPGTSDIIDIKKEKSYGDSRLDFLLKDSTGKEIYIEVKGVTLEEDGIVKFPDAKTERGERHIRELIKAKKEGFETAIIFIIQMEGAKYFTPNYKMHDSFGETLKEARKTGVKILAYDSIVKEDSLEVNKEVAVKL